MSKLLYNQKEKEFFHVQLCCIKEHTQFKFGQNSILQYPLI